VKEGLLISLRHSEDLENKQQSPLRASLNIWPQRGFDLQAAEKLKGAGIGNWQSCLTDFEKFPKQNT
jgi:hypothetical protein